MRKVGLVLAAAVLGWAAAACGDDESPGTTSPELGDTQEIRFLVVHSGDRPGVEIIDEGPEKLSRDDAKNRAEQVVDFDFQLPSNLPSSLEIVELKVWQNPDAPLLLLRRGVIVTFAKVPEFDDEGVLTGGEIILTLDIGHPREGPLPADGDEVIDILPIGRVVVSGNGADGDNAYVWLVEQVRYRLAYDEDGGRFTRDEVSAMIASTGGG